MADGAVLQLSQEFVFRKWAGLSLRNNADGADRIRNGPRRKQRRVSTRTSSVVHFAGLSITFAAKRNGRDVRRDLGPRPVWELTNAATVTCTNQS